MEFSEAADRLTATRITNQDIADACGVSRNSIERARMTGEHGRTAPPGWERAVAQLAIQRSEQLSRLAEELSGSMMHQ
jgi:hypothetical protein